MNIIKHIKENQPWTADKEMELIHELGGATKWGDDYYVTYKYPLVCEQLDEAMGELAKESTTDPKEFAEEMANFNV